MRTEVVKIVSDFDIKIVDSIDKANALLDSFKGLYACIVTGKLTKQGEEKYYAVCMLEKKLTDADKAILARLYLETVILHSAVREKLVDKIPAKASKKSKGML
jgi:hypothetical protein